MKSYERVAIELHAFLTSALDGGVRSASRPGALPPEERAPRYPLDRRLGGPQSRSGHGGEQKKIPTPAGKKPGCPACNLISTLT
jgi:hypothetical protein